MNLTFFKASKLAFGPVESSTVEGKTYHWRSLYIKDGDSVHRIDFHGSPADLIVEEHETDFDANPATAEPF